MSILDSKLEKEGVKEIRYYYKNIPIIGNIYTCCVFLSEDKKILARGLAICSVGDSHTKKIGRKLSKTRATSAIYKKSDSLEINKSIIYLERFSDKRHIETMNKVFKIKNKKQQEELVQEILDLGFEHEIVDFNPFKKLTVLIPISYPMDLTCEEFKFKSQYMPQPTMEEKKMFNLN